ncbi:GCN5-related N-acetyltransferase [Denitrovibrio acetiphilus DSM 12809]|uniref:GCN5-related N-acetyltransferase n=1 Tax=Denitrovibrio acetiphilus (strain DSM 12809 / NBRC 114555 / N2460) TaxID=522772 RepID=D4H1P4_DENA2|nr:GNAT family N-acetyltransferase [Denitrovibrio acetiphilus]ADD68804.1 GCN5-related N-acetyltransferase [Denitrovibrio acetiphilus DSM 12809]
MGIIIRKAGKQDIPSLIVLMDYLLGLEGDFPNMPERQRKGFEMILDSESSEVFVAEKGEKIVGMCSLHKFISTVQGSYAGVLEDVVVDEDFAGMGIGGMLITHIEKYAKAQGITRLQLMVDQNNDSAIALYKKYHWSQTKYIGFRKYL